MKQLTPQRLKRLIPQRLGLLKRIKRQWILVVAAILSVLGAWGIHETKFLAGSWGIRNDEIATITVEKGAHESNTPEIITVVDPSKSVWDALELLGVPLALAVFGAWFQRAQQEQSERLSKEQREQESDETRGEVLQLYFDRISTLLIDKNLMEIAAKESSASGEQKKLLEVSTDVIRARTLSILRRFDKDVERKSSVVRFLAEAKVISKLNINLSSANLSRVHLRYANLSCAFLPIVDLSSADLDTVDLRNAELSVANLRNINLCAANLSGGNTALNGADLSEANLYRADLSGADLSGADLREANLSNTALNGADLRDTKLSNTNLRGADLSDADLRGVNLSNARNATTEQLMKATLCKTILPEGIDLDPDRDCESLER